MDEEAPFAAAVAAAPVALSWVSCFALRSRGVILERTLMGGEVAGATLAQSGSAVVSGATLRAKRRFWCRRLTSSMRTLIVARPRSVLRCEPSWIVRMLWVRTGSLSSS